MGAIHKYLIGFKDKSIMKTMLELACYFHVYNQSQVSSFTAPAAD